MPDWNAVGDQFLLGLAWGAGFAMTAVVGITWAFLKLLSHPTVRNLSKAAAKFGEGGGWNAIIEKGASWLFGGK